MKKFLLLTFLFSVLSSAKILAQPCSLRNLQIVSMTTDPTTGQCLLTVSFEMDRNNGNKFIYGHFWNKGNFSKVDKSKFTKGHGPKYNDINGAGDAYKSLATISINNMDYDVPIWSAQNYRPDNTVTSVKGSNISVSPTPVSGGFYKYTITGIPLGVLGADCSITNVDGIFWSTQANSGNSPIHCSLVGATTNPPQPTISVAVTGSSNCATGMYTLNIQNNSTVAVSVDYDVYVDNGGGSPDMVLDPGSDTRLEGADDIIIAANTTYSVTRPVPVQYRVFDLWAQVVVNDNNTIVRSLPASACGALPVSLKSFDAKRSNKNVSVKWETSTEQNVKGYHVQRNINGTWENIGFVASNSANGNSNTAQSYQFTDVNTYKGVSQYRIQMTEFSGTAKVSDVRSVRGESQVNKLMVYPNPSSNGKFNVVFDDAESTRDVFINDMSGKLIKQWKTVSNNNLQIDNLLPGMYTLKIVNNASGTQTIEKLVVSKR